MILKSLYIAGIGALYVRRRPRVRVEALQSGGGQERGMRSGTLPAPLVVGLGAACEVAMEEMEVIRIRGEKKNRTITTDWYLFRIK